MSRVPSEPIVTRRLLIVSLLVVVALSSQWLIWYAAPKQLPMVLYFMPLVLVGVGAIGGAFLVPRKVRKLSPTPPPQKRLSAELDGDSGFTNPVRAIFNASTHIAIIATDPTGNITFFNAGATRLLGYSAEEVIGRNKLTALHRKEEVDDRVLRVSEILKRRATPSTAVYAAVREQGLDEQTWTYICKDRTERTLRVILTPQFGLNGALIGYVEVGVDISDLRQTERLLRATDARNRALLNAIPDLMFVQSPEGIFQECHAPLALRDILQLDRYVGRPMEELLGSAQSRWFRDLFHQVGVDQTLLVHEYPLHVGTEERWFEARVVSCGADQILTIARDVTASRRDRAELVRAKQAAESANRAKDTFLANISHELRTPMNGVLGMLAIARESEAVPKQRDRLNAAHDAARGLLMVLNDLLDFARLDAKKFPLDPAPFSLAEELESLARSVAMQCEVKELAFEFRAAANLPPAVVGDAGRLRQVLTNLLGNAIKFTERGFVKLIVDGEHLGDGFMIRFQILDSGIGIPTSALTRIFEPFEQVDPSISRRYGGSGLGLTISTRLIEQMNGTITAESQTGKGSTFTVSVRLPVATLSSLGVPESVRPIGPLRILVAEDSPVNQLVAQEFLEHVGHTVTIVDNGLDAVFAHRDTRFDLILMDLQMPELDGIGAVKMIRADEGTERVPIIALTARATAETRRDCHAAGMDGFLAKPIQAEELHREILRVIQTPTPRAAKPLASKNPESYRKLVALFSADAKELLTALRDAIADRNHDALDAAAHKLGGSLGYFGSGPATDAMDALQKQVSSADWTTIGQQVIRLDQEVRRLIRELKSSIS